MTRSNLHRCLQRHGVSRLADLLPDIEHRTPLVKHPWTNGMVEAMNKI